jgi:hypothetical protein
VDYGNGASFSLAQRCRSHEVVLDFKKKSSHFQQAEVQKSWAGVDIYVESRKYEGTG